MARHRVVSDHVESNAEPLGTVSELDAERVAVEFNELFARLNDAQRVHVMSAAIDSMKSMVPKAPEHEHGG